MANETSRWRTPRAWISLIALLIALIFAYFYQPFEDYLIKSIPNVHFYNVVFWFVSLVAVVGYVIAHWQAFRRFIFRASAPIDTDALVFTTLQIALLIAVILCAGATLQAVVMLSAQLMGVGPNLDATFGSRILAIIVLVILTVLFYLLHYAIRAIRSGWKPRRAPPGARS